MNTCLKVKIFSVSNRERISLAENIQILPNSKQITNKIRSVAYTVERAWLEGLTQAFLKGVGKYSHLRLDGECISSTTIKNIPGNGPTFDLALALF